MSNLPKEKTNWQFIHFVVPLAVMSVLLILGDSM